MKLILVLMLFNVYGIKVIDTGGKELDQLRQIEKRFTNIIKLETIITKFTKDSVIIGGGIEFKLDPQCVIYDSYGRNISPFGVKSMLPAEAQITLKRAGKSVIVKEIKITKSNIDRETKTIPIKSQIR